MTIQYNSKGKIISKRFTLDQLQQASDDSIGFCRACGAERDCCEPDARHYPCDECGRNDVFGAEELGLMGLVKDQEVQS